MSDSTATYTTRWADMDANGHLRHSAYADFAADQRVRFLASVGYDLAAFTQLRIGPILFREDSRYLKEIRLGETLRVEGRLLTMTDDGSRWTIEHTLYKEDGRPAATVTVDGAWLDLDRRKLATPPAALVAAMRTL